MDVWSVVHRTDLPPSAGRTPLRPGRRRPRRGPPDDDGDRGPAARRPDLPGRRPGDRSGAVRRIRPAVRGRSHGLLPGRNSGVPRGTARLNGRMSHTDRRTAPPRPLAPPARPQLPGPGPPPGRWDPDPAARPAPTSTATASAWAAGTPPRPPTRTPGCAAPPTRTSCAGTRPWSRPRTVPPPGPPCGGGPGGTRTAPRRRSASWTPPTARRWV